MKLAISKRIKIFVLCLFLVSSVIGFMIKLPSAFRHYDKELHSLFYFLAAAFLNVFFVKNKIGLHILIFVLLSLFGIAIEYAQEYSNKFFHVRIHGRFDKEDVLANLKGLVVFSILWLIYYVFTRFRKSN